MVYVQIYPSHNNLSNFFINYYIVFKDFEDLKFINWRWFQTNSYNQRDMWPLSQN